MAWAAVKHNSDSLKIVCRNAEEKNRIKSYHSFFFEDASLFTNCIQKHIAYQTTKFCKKIERKVRKGKDTLLKANMNSIQNKPSGNWSFSVVQVMSEWTWLIQLSVLTKAMFDF